MEHYVTLFDSLYMPQGLALHKSMERHIKDYTLWILCVNDEAYELLTKLDLPNVRLLKLSKLETNDLLRVKVQRGIGEYCWTLTPFAPRFVFETDHNVHKVTYIDADLWFMRNPKDILFEFINSNKQVLITDHAYAPEYDQSATSGQYCVQFMTFNRDGGEIVRKWWEERCIEWCFARFENGKFGDQKYLDDWPDRFERYVHVLKHSEWTLAPWNATRYPYSQAIFFHFHGLRITGNNSVDFGPIYNLPVCLIENVYDPYVKDLSDSISIIRSFGGIIHPQIESVGFQKIIKRFLSGIYHQIWRFHNLNFRKF